MPELPEYLEAVDNLPESEVPDLLDTGSSIFFYFYDYIIFAVMDTANEAT